MTSLAAAARRLHQARAALDRATEVARQAARQAVESGMSEVEVAERMKVNRGTVRRWLGK